MDMVSASCTVSKGDLPMEIRWLHNGQRPISNNGISISRTNQRISILSIESAQDYHSGNYSCVAENAAGSVNYTASLWVNGRDPSTAICQFVFYLETNHVLLIPIAAIFIILLSCKWFSIPHLP